MFNPFGWIKPLGKWVKKAMGFVEKYVSDENLAKAVALVKIARDKFLDNELKKAFVLGELLKLGISGSMANLILELAVAIVKKELDEA